MVKNELIASFITAQDQILTDFYNVAFADGVESLLMNAQDKEKLDAAIARTCENKFVSDESRARLTEALNDVIRELGFGKAPQLQE